jgi:Protein of unknown function (DUF3253)
LLLDLAEFPGDPARMTPNESPKPPVTTAKAETPAETLIALESTLLSLIAARGLDKTICPSEAARALGGDHPDGWGPLMQPIRRVAVRLAKEGRLIITRKGRTVDPDDFRGVYRLGLPRLD